ncbi:PRELI domain-containing protein 1, mitochondrial-like [Astyanax mexicanus]|uniref:PRELI domain-containing protein 1, mitochondrial-like n=1 Tax=Astyanax mexicanus TaxID=7994 RepID=UPI0020CB20D4|nr:PRELI domain-containing protein 1, mitochondrial-like [Astyanax mexicanus]
MVTDFSFVGLLKGTWNQVSTAFWQKYPNPYSTNVLTEDVIFREVTPDNRLLSRRLLTKTGPVPRWAESFLPSFTAYYVIEDSVVDPVNKTIVTSTRNTSHTHFISVKEQCVYRVNPEDSNWTEISKKAWISSSMFGLSKRVKELGLARVKDTVPNTMKGFEYILAKMLDEGKAKDMA